MTSLLRFAIVLVALLALSAGARADDIVFNRDIRPILTDNCSACHGPDAKQRQAELRLDIREVALEKKAIVPGQPDGSELIARIESDGFKAAQAAAARGDVGPVQDFCARIQHILDTEHGVWSSGVPK